MLWLDHVKAADLSDGTIADYAVNHGLRLMTLYQWKLKESHSHRSGAGIYEQSI